MLTRILKVSFFALFVRPIVLIILGLNVRNKQWLPRKGPAVIVANHNSHLDTLVLMSLYPLSQIHKVRPVAAADYFLRHKALAWFALNIIGIIPLDRSHFKRDLFKQCHEALDQGDILLIFPEGSRGNAEQLSKLKSGVHHLLKDGHQETPVCPVMLHGLGMALPKGTALLVPFNCDVIIGEVTTIPEKSQEFIQQLEQTFQQLSTLCLTRHQVVDRANPDYDN